LSTDRVATREIEVRRDERIRDKEPRLAEPPATRAVAEPERLVPKPPAASPLAPAAEKPPTIAIGRVHVEVPPPPVPSPPPTAASRARTTPAPARAANDFPLSLRFGLGQV
jgi:hypothetical protein